MLLQYRGYMTVQTVVQILRKFNNLIILLKIGRVVELDDFSKHADVDSACVLSIVTPFFMTRKFTAWKSCLINIILRCAKEVMSFPKLLVKALTMAHLNHFLIRQNVIAAQLHKWFDGIGLLGWGMPNFQWVKLVENQRMCLSNSLALAMSCTFIDDITGKVSKKLSGWRVAKYQRRSRFELLITWLAGILGNRVYVSTTRRSPDASRYTDASERVHYYGCSEMTQSTTRTRDWSLLS